MSSQPLGWRVVTSSAAIGASSVFGNVVRLGVIAFLARYLTATDFGMLGLAIVLAQLGQQVGVAGLDVYVIRRRDIAPEVLDTIFWMALAFTVTLASMWVFGRFQIEGWFDSPGLAPYVVVISLAVVVSGIGVVPQALLQKALRYREFAIAESVGSVAQAIVGVALAIGHFGIWALIWGYFAQEAVKTVLFFRYAGFVPRLRWSGHAASAALRFSLPALGDRCLTFLTLNADRVIIGKLLGPAPLGLYVLTVEIVTFPARRVIAVLARVLFPALSELQHDVTRMAHAYLRVARIVSLIIIPAFVGLDLVAPELVSVLFGDQWPALGSLIRVLSVVGIVTALLTPCGAVLYGRGRPDLAFYWAFLTAVVVPVCIIIGSRWGLFHAALAHSIAWVTLLPVMLVLQARLLRLPFGALGREYAAGVGVAIVVLVAVVSAQAVTSVAAPSSALRLGVSVASGVISYCAAVWVMERSAVSTVLGRVAGVAGLTPRGT